MAGKFELKKAGNGQFQFHLKASNGQVILASEQYTERRGALRGIESVKKNAPVDNRYERKTAKNGQHYFVLRASNGGPSARARCTTPPARWTRASSP